MTKFSDESLMLYADSLLDACESERLQQGLARDAKLRARLQVFRATGRSLAALFEQHAASPLPPKLRDIVNGVAPTTSPAPVYDLRRHSRARVWRKGWSSRAALAASVALLAGIGFGWLLHGELAGNSASPQELVRANGGRLIASDVLERSLESQPSGREVAAGSNGLANVSVKMTFQNTAGEYCRQYQVTAQQSQHYVGMACHVDGVWRVDFQTPTPPARSAVAQTVPASGSSELMDAVIGAVIAGDPLSGPDEAALLNRRWAK